MITVIQPPPAVDWFIGVIQPTGSRSFGIDPAIIRGRTLTARVRYDVPQATFSVTETPPMSNVPLSVRRPYTTWQAGFAIGSVVLSGIGFAMGVIYPNIWTGLLLPTGLAGVWLSSKLVGDT